MKLNLALIISLYFLCQSGLKSQSKSIHFKVDMNYQISKGNFDTGNNFVDIAGSFNGWNGENHKLTDTNDDNIFEIFIDDFSVGQQIEFKFRIDGVWDGREEFPGGGDNRTLTVIEGENVVDVWYNNEVPADAGLKLAFSSENSSIQTGSVLQFTNQTTGVFTEVEWTFEGGFPNTSTTINPAIRYEEPGEYDVALKVSDGLVTESILLENYVQVAERSTDELDWWNDAVFYEIFVRSFKDSDGDGIGDFNGIIEKLDYLNDGDPTTTEDLGISAIWLMPIHPSPSYHGYDVTDYNGINPDYGDIEDFKNLVKEAHDRGIKIIIDFVMNHSSTEHPWFEDAVSSAASSKRNYFSWRTNRPNQSGPWGQEVWHNSPSGYYYGLFWGGMPDLNYKDPEVKSAIMSSADYWLNEVGIDGLRLDAIKYIIEDGNQLEDTEATFTFWKQYQQEIKSLKSSAFSVGEAWTNTDRVLDYVNDGGLDICFEFDMASAILSAVNNQNAQVVSGQAQKIYNIYPNNQFGTFLTNHDMNRAIETFGNSVDKMKTAAAIYLTLPGTPFIYYGEEINMKGTKPDEFIRRPMQWDNSSSSGFSEGTPWIALNANFPSANVATLKEDPASTLNWYDQLIQIRNDEEVLRRGSYEPFDAENKNIYSFSRTYNGSTIVVIVNLSDFSIATSFDAFHTTLSTGQQNFTNLVDGNDIALSITEDRQVQSFSIDPREVMILKSTTTTSNENILIDNSDRVKVWPSPVDNLLQINIDDYEGQIRYSILDVEGKVVVSSQFNHGEDLAVEGLVEGIYVLKMSIDEVIYVHRFVKM